jgi:hypothetical protein
MMSDAACSPARAGHGPPRAGTRRPGWVHPRGRPRRWSPTKGSTRHRRRTAAARAGCVGLRTANALELRLVTRAPARAAAPSTRAAAAPSTRAAAAPSTRAGEESQPTTVTMAGPPSVATAQGTARPEPRGERRPDPRDVTPGALAGVPSCLRAGRPVPRSRTGAGGCRRRISAGRGRSRPRRMPSRFASVAGRRADRRDG